MRPLVYKWMYINKFNGYSMRFLYPDAPGVRPYVFERLMDWYFWIYDGEYVSDKKGGLFPTIL